MRRSLLTLLALLTTAALRGQRLDPGYYRFPLEGVQGYYSANFGEMRPNHFHSGVDIKTDGVTGKPVVAAADGYVARIGIAPWGYGRVLYVAHPNGTTTVYGHLDRFRDDIEAYVRERRYALRRHAVDLYCTPGEFPVRQGDRIASSGNSGQSFGPHLHFEVRRTADQATLNTLAAGVLPVRDRIAPLILRLHYVEIDSVRGVAVEAPLQSCDVVQNAPGSYRLRRSSPLPVGRRGYFLLEASDRKEGTANTYGLYRVTACVDSLPVYEYRMEGFRFDQTRYCNAVAYYPLQLFSRNEVLRLAQAEACPDIHYPTLRDRGTVSVSPGQRRTVEIAAEDDCGNRSVLRFTVEGKAADACFRAPRRDSALVARPDATFRYADRTAGITLPRGTLYASCFYTQAPYDGPLPERPGLRFLTRGVTLLDALTPLHDYATVTLRCEVPEALRPHVAAASLSPKGALRYEGGTYADGRLTLRTRSLGTFFVVADTVPPTIRPRFTPGDLRDRRELVFAIGDDFSGIASFEGEIDGAWIPFEQNTVQGTITHPLDAARYGRNKRHTFALRVTDACGNTTRWSCEFLW